MKLRSSRDTVYTVLAVVSLADRSAYSFAPSRDYGGVAVSIRGAR